MTIYIVNDHSQLYVNTDLIPVKYSSIAPIYLHFPPYFVLLLLYISHSYMLYTLQYSVIIFTSTITFLKKIEEKIKEILFI